jgi:hypothetical protein
MSTIQSIKPNLSSPDRAAVETTVPVTTLQSWKEIASEFNRGVRTVQRWERELKMPIRRLGKGLRAPVFALRSELHSWLQTMGGGLRPSGKRGGSHDAGCSTEVRMEPNTGLLQAIEKLFRTRPSRWAKEKCMECGSPMNFLKGQFWIYGTRKKWKACIPFCPVCNGDMLNADRHSHQIQ